MPGQGKIEDLEGQPPKTFNMLPLDLSTTLATKAPESRFPKPIAKRDRSPSLGVFVKDSTTSRMQ